MRIKRNRLAGLLLAVGCIALFLEVRVKAADPVGGAAPAAGTSDATATAGQKDQRAPLALPAGATAAKEIDDAAKVGGPLETCTDEALKRDVGMSGLRSCFVEQDRNRIKDIEKLDSTQLKATAKQIGKAFKDKYNEEFAFEPGKVFSGIQVIQGEIQDPQQFAQNWPVAVTGTTATAAEPQQASAQVRTLDEDTRKNGFIDKGREAAILRLPAEGALPALDVSLIKGPYGWKIDVPNTRTAQQIHDDLQEHLSLLASNTSKWPTDANQAKRGFVRHVIMAIYGADMPAAGTAEKAAGQAPPAQPTPAAPAQPAPAPQ